MVIDGKKYNEEDFVVNESNFITKHNNIYISENQINILQKYDIDINSYNSVNELIYDIENYLNDSYDELEDLEWVSETLAEYNYYNNTNK